MNRTRQVFLNTLVTVATRVGVLLVGFVLTPYTVSTLGQEVFGLWAVLTAVVAYFGLLDLGLGSTFVRYIAEYAARRDIDNVRQVVTFGGLFYIALGLILAPPVFWLAPWLIGFLKLSPELVDTAVNIFLLIYCYFFLFNAASTFGSLLTGLEQMRITSYVVFGSQLTYGLAVFLLLYYGYGIYGMIAAIFAQLLVYSIATYALSRRLFGPVFFNPFHFKLSTIKQLFSFGGWMQVTNASSTINMETDRLIIANFVNVASVTSYEIGNKLSLLTRVLPLVLLGAMLPAAAAIQGEGEGRKLDAVYVQISRYLALSTFLIAGLVVGAARPIVQLWMGREYPEVPVIITLLVFAYVINNLTGVGTTLLRAVNQPRYESYYSIGGAALNLLATLMLAPRFGLLGILVGTVIGSTLGSIYFLWLFHRVREISWWSSMGSWLWKLIVVTITTGGSLWLVIYSLPNTIFTSKLLGLIILGMLGLLYFVSFIFLLRFVHFLEPEDLTLLEQVLPAGFASLLKSRFVFYLFRLSSGRISP